MRILDIQDAAELQSLLARNKDLMVPWIPWAMDEPQSIETKKDKILEWRTEFILNTKYTYGIFSKEVMIGLIFLFTRQGKGKLEIGYIIDQENTGKGYATEASYAMTKLGFEELKIDNMVIHCNSRNIASAKIPEKLGYEIVERETEGSTEMLIWSLPIDMFKPIPKYEPLSFIKRKVNEKV